MVYLRGGRQHPCVLHALRLYKSPGQESLIMACQVPELLLQEGWWLPWVTSNSEHDLSSEHDRMSQSLLL